MIEEINQEYVNNLLSKIDNLSSQLEQIKDHMKCSICLEHLCNPVQLETESKTTNKGKIKCTHKFCLICIRDYFGMNERHKNYQNFKCPICREEVHSNPPYYHQLSDHIILDIIQNDEDLECPRKCGYMWTSQSCVKNHLFKDCPEGFTQCNKCRITIKRNQLDKHIEDCNLTDKINFTRKAINANN